MTALMKAVKAHNVALVNELIQQGANVNELDANHDAPLVMAAYNGDTAIVQALLAAGADVTAVDPGMKATALHAAAYAGRTEAVRLLLQYHIAIDQQGPYNGYTALHDAIWQGHVETAKVLIEAGANLTIQAKSGETPVAFAKSRQQTEILAFIEQTIAAR